MNEESDIVYSENYMDSSNLENDTDLLVENTNVVNEIATEIVEDIAPESSEVIENATVSNESNNTETLKLTQLPLARIKSIMKMDPDVTLASSEAVFVVTKATELFIDSIAKEAYSHTAKAKRKIITKKDLDAVIDTVDCLCFLDGAMDI